MALKKLITFLVLLWTMHHYRAKRIIKAKYRETRVVNYRQDNDDFNTLSTCTFLDCDEYRMDNDGQIDTTRCKRTVGIQYKHESKEDISQVLFPNQWLGQNMERYINTKVCYYKIFTVDTCIYLSNYLIC